MDLGNVKRVISGWTVDLSRGLWWNGQGGTTYSSQNCLASPLIWMEYVDPGQEELVRYD
jgi:hypothetical protein